MKNLIKSIKIKKPVLKWLLFVFVMTILVLKVKVEKDKISYWYDINEDPLFMQTVINFKIPNYNKVKTLLKKLKITEEEIIRSLEYSVYESDFNLSNLLLNRVKSDNLDTEPFERTRDFSHYSFSIDFSGHKCIFAQLMWQNNVELANSVLKKRKNQNLDCNSLAFAYDIFYTNNNIKNIELNSNFKLGISTFISGTPVGMANLYKIYIPNASMTKDIDLLWVSFYSKNLEMVNLFIDKGANLDVKNRNSELYFTVRNNFEDGLNFLIANGISAEQLNLINTHDRDRTMLMLASDLAYPNITKILLGAGIDITLKDKDGLTALDFAKKRYQDCKDYHYCSIKGELNTRSEFLPIQLANIKLLEDALQRQDNKDGQGVDKL